MTMRWYARQRMAWIAETLRVFGYINRHHLQLKFGISKPQASADLTTFQRLYPDAMKYNQYAKYYQATTPPIRKD